MGVSLDEIGWKKYHQIMKIEEEKVREQHLKWWRLLREVYGMSTKAKIKMSGNKK